MRRPLLASLCLVAIAFTPAVSAQQDAFFVTFHFDTLWFRFHPDGLGSSKGSGLEVFAENVKIEGDEATDLRHCIDGWGQDECSYGDLLHAINYSGNQDGTVTPDEVAAFTSIAKPMAGQIEKLKRLSAVLKSNVSVDGMKGGDPKVVDVVFRSAEGSVDSTNPAYTDVKVEVGYENDQKAKSHQVDLHNIALSNEGFQYSQARWTVEGDAKWDYKPDKTQPDGAKGFVTKDGWVSNQPDFESHSNQSIKLVVELPKKKTPGLEVVGVLGALAVALVVVRRR